MMASRQTVMLVASWLRCSAVSWSALGSRGTGRYWLRSIGKAIAKRPPTLAGVDLDANSVPYTFHDFRVDGIDKTLVNNFLKQVDVDTLINKRGTTWRKLSDEEKEIKTKAQAVELMIENPAIIKRPVLDVNKKITVGFNVENYKSLKF